MTYPYNVNGVGLDAIFDPYLSGTKAALTGYTVNGVDLRDIFAPLYLGTSAAVTHYKVNNADLNTIFAAKGSVQYALPIDGMTFNGFSSGNISGAMTARVTASIGSDGGFSVTCLGNQTATTTQLGDWLPSGESVSQYQVRFTVTELSRQESGPATIDNGAAAFVSCTASRSVSVSAAVGQHSAFTEGGSYRIEIALKKISTGVVNTTTIVANVSSSGTA